MLSKHDVLEEWFGTLDDQGAPAPEKVSSWWTKSEQFDAYLRERYGDLVEQALGNELNWQGPEGTLAEIILLDQFSRNIFRGTPKMYAGDARAVELSRALTSAGAEALPHAQRVFVYMPLMHSETAAEQDLCIRCFEELIKSAPEGQKAMLSQNLKAAHDHRDIVTRFGRFPHRNTILGRVSTKEEVEFLKQPGSSF